MSGIYVSLKFILSQMNKNSNLELQKEFSSFLPAAQAKIILTKQQLTEIWWAAPAPNHGPTGRRVSCQSKSLT